MKLLLTLTLLFILPANAQEENPFDNWLFKFFEGESENFGDILGPNGEELDQGAGKIVTTINLKTKEAKSTSTTRFKNREGKFKSVTTETPKGKNIFTGTTKDSTGATFTHTLTIIDEKSYKSIVKYPDGSVLTIDGKLKNENTIETTEIMSDADGKLLLRFKVTYKRAKKKEQSGD